MCEKSSGMPTWCEQLLQELIKDGVLILTKGIPSNDLAMISPAKSYLIKRRVICNPVSII